jgi:hypothetical protein
MSDNNEKDNTNSDGSVDNLDVTTETVTATTNETPSGKNTSCLRTSTRKSPSKSPSKGKELFRSPASSTRSKNNRKRTATSSATTPTASGKKKKGNVSKSNSSKKNNVTLKPPPVDVTYEADKKKMIELEEHAIELVEKLAKDPRNKELQLETRAAERLFRQSLFVLKSRNGPGISWAGWTSDYCKEIQVSAYGEEYAKTREYILYYIHSTNITHDTNIFLFYYHTYYRVW